MSVRLFIVLGYCLVLSVSSRKLSRPVRSWSRRRPSSVFGRLPQFFIGNRSRLTRCGTALRNRQRRLLPTRLPGRNRVWRLLPFCGSLSLQISLPSHLPHHNVEFVCNSQIIAISGCGSGNHKKCRLCLPCRDQAPGIGNGLRINFLPDADTETLGIIHEFFVSLVNKLNFEAKGIEAQTS